MDVENVAEPPLPGPRLQIAFQQLTYTIEVKEGKGSVKKRDILKDVIGVLQPARLTAVMGASGAGKTTLLNVLAGFGLAHAHVSGCISVNGVPMSGDRMRRISGFVHQEDVILHTMTVREVLVFSAMLKLPTSLPAPQKVRRALDVASTLNLQKSLDSLVGSAMIKGISGGEKRRLSLGMEMVTEPSILFLDEPSSGLDAFNAFKVVHILRSLAHHRARTVVCTIHQPSSEIFHMFDDLLVLADGQLLYHGAIVDMVDWFAKLGYRCPEYTNPADYLFMDVLNAAVLQGERCSSDGSDIGRGGAEGTSAGAKAVIACPGQLDGKERGVSAVGPAAASTATTSAGAGDRAMAAAPTSSSTPDKDRAAEEARIAALIAAWRASPQAEQLQRVFTSGELVDSGITKEAETAHAPFWLQLLLLAKRAARNAWRNPLVVRGKLAQVILLSLIVGLIYLRLSDDLSGVQDRQGSLFFLVVQGMFGSVMGVLTVFGAEKGVFQREFGNRMYGLPAYFISRWLVELPSQIVLPVMSACICYWMVGYQNTPAKFGWFALTLVLMDCCGSALGIFVSCIFNDIAAALSVIPLFLLPLMVFSGFFVNSNTIPPYFSWIQYISPMHYGFIALVKNEFSGLQITCTPEQACAPGFNGDSVIRNMGFDDKGSVGQNAGILFAMMVGLLLMAYIALWGSARRLVR